MDKITSFTINHKELMPGLYISRIDNIDSSDAVIITYDLRLIKPNCPPYLDNAGLHTFEHLGATYLRNSSYSNSVLYFGPMGCRTGFYLLMNSKVFKEEIIELIKAMCKFIKTFTGIIPGTLEEECGNYKEHDLLKAQEYASNYCDVLQSWVSSKMNY